MPRKSTLTDLISKALGYPSLIRRIQAPVILKMLDPKKDETILDSGCGSGFFTSEIAQKANFSVGIDLCLRERLALMISEQPGKMFAIADMQKLPFGHQVFDKILLSSVLQVVNDEALIGECRRVLKNDGIIVLSVPTEYCYFTSLNKIKPQLGLKAQARGKAYYEPKDLALLFRKFGFKIVSLECSPKKLGTLVCEMEIYLWHHLRLPLFSSIFFPFFYPLLYIENNADKQQNGNELIIKVKKIT
jgi:ubiquinone/menaquinone biosynthesis C-methylase UbiE